MSEKVSDHVKTNQEYSTLVAMPIIASPKITLICRNCNNTFQRPVSVSTAHNEYYRCNNCRGIKSINLMSLCMIQ